MYKRKITAILFAAALSAAITGCGAANQELQNPDSITDVTQAPTPVATVAATAMPTPAKINGFIPTTAPTATNAPTQVPTPAPTEAPKLLITDINAALEALKEAGVVAASPDAVTTVPELLTDYIEIESVQTAYDGYVVVTLSGRLETVNPSDITLKGYNDNWYSLKLSSYEMSVTDSAVTVNKEGKTVIVYEVSNRINGTKVMADTANKKFSNLQAEITKAENYMSWQMDHGGWDKGVENQAKKAWTAGTDKNATSGWFGKKGEVLGTIDNEATYAQMRQIAAVYREVPEKKYQESVLKGLDFLFLLQFESGGFAQVYPARGNYSDNVTFNDDAMVNVLIMLEDMRDKRYPFDSDIIPEEYMVKIEDSIERAVDYILKAQIVQNGKLTAWCAQHDPVTYEPVGARSYELPSISGSESVGIIMFLMNQEQTPEIAQAVEAAIQWFKDSEVKGTKYVRKDSNGVYFVEDKNSSIWYRFYDLETNEPIFSDRDGIKKNNILEIGEERRHGYSWAGDYAKNLLKTYDAYGYFGGKIEAVVVANASTTAEGKTLEQGSSMTVSTEIQ